VELFRCEHPPVVGHDRLRPKTGFILRAFSTHSVCARLGGEIWSSDAGQCVSVFRINKCRNGSCLQILSRMWTWCCQNYPNCLWILSVHPPMFSAYLFHSLGFSSTGTVTRSFRFRCSMYRFATRGWTGLSIAVSLSVDLSPKVEVNGCDHDLWKFHYIIHFQ